MLNSLFGRRRKKPAANVPTDDSIRSAKLGDVVFIPGFWDTGEDAYLIVEQTNRMESGYGESHEVVGVDGDRRATIEWSDHDGLHVSVTRQERPLGLSAVGLDYDILVRWDDHKSIENSIEYEGQRYLYRNSHESFYFKGGDREGEGFFTWEFITEDDGAAITVVKWEGLPFEVYTSEFISPHLVTVYNK